MRVEPAECPHNLGGQYYAQDIILYKMADCLGYVPTIVSFVDLNKDEKKEWRDWATSQEYPTIIIEMPIKPLILKEVLESMPLTHPSLIW